MNICILKVAKKMSLGKLEINNIYNMDCVEGMKMLPDNSVDLVDLSSGVYTITTQTSEGLAIQKFIKI